LGCVLYATLTDTLYVTLSDQALRLQYFLVRITVTEIFVTMNLNIHTKCHSTISCFIHSSRSLSYESFIPCSKRVLHRVRSSASSFNIQFPLSVLIFPSILSFYPSFLQ
jgi:hypothetical protein